MERLLKKKKKEIIVELFNSSKIDVQELKLTSFT